jgi:flavorubredoxin
MDTYAPKPPARHHPPQEIAPDTYLIRQLFGEGEAPVSVYVNSMVIAGPEAVVVDTGTVVNRDQWFDDLFSIVDPEDIAYVFLSHDDHDHTGNLLPLLDAAPRAQLVTTWFTTERLAGDLSIPAERMRWRNDGDTFEAGGRTLAVIRPPVYDSPVTRGLYDPRSGVYWAVDAYATTVPHAVERTDELDPEFWDEQFLGLNRMNSPWTTLADPTRFGREVDRIASLDVTAIASAHSPVISRSSVVEAHAKMRRVAGGPATPLPTQVDLDALVAARTRQPALTG